MASHSCRRCRSSLREPLEANDILLVCSDGLWGGLDDDEIGASFPPARAPLREELHAPRRTLGDHRGRRQRQHLGRRGALDRERLMSARPSGRAPDELRAVRFTRHYTKHAEGSVLVEFGNTRVLCTASVEEGVPGFLRGKNQGWVTAEYGMLPRATHTRTRARSGQGQAERPHAGNPAADRPLAARGDRSRGARRTHDHARLRRAAGRRRHAHRGDYRRLSSRWPMPATRCSRSGSSRHRRCTARSRRSRSASAGACR